MRKKRGNIWGNEIEKEQIMQIFYMLTGLSWVTPYHILKFNGIYLPINLFI